MLIRGLIHYKYWRLTSVSIKFPRLFTAAPSIKENIQEMLTLV